MWEGQEESSRGRREEEEREERTMNDSRTSYYKQDSRFSSDVSVGTSSLVDKVEVSSRWSRDGAERMK